MNQALRAVESSIVPEEKTTSPEPKTARVSPPNSSWTAKSGGKITVTVLPGVPALPNADTGNDIRLWLRRRSRSVDPPVSTRSNLRFTVPLWPEYRRWPSDATTITPDGDELSTIAGRGSPIAEVAAKSVAAGGNVSWTWS